MQSKPLHNTTIAVERLRDLVFTGKLAANSSHLESELAEALGMSRTPVREALRTLAAQGLVEIRPRHGVRICAVSPRDMAEIYDVLTELESLAASDAAGRGLGAGDLANLAQFLDEMDAALARNDRAAWAERDDGFHCELVRLGGNSRVIGIVGMMADQVRRARLVTLYMRPNPVQSNADHRGVYEAIRAGHAHLASDLHRAHRRAAKRMLLDLLTRHHLSSL